MVVGDHNCHNQQSASGTDDTWEDGGTDNDCDEAADDDKQFMLQI